MNNTAEQLNYKQIYSSKFNQREINKISEILQFMFNKNDRSGFIKFRHDNTIRNLKVSDIANTYKIRQVLDAFETKEDIFISKNVFRTMETMEESNIQAITMLVIDIDYKNIKDFKLHTNKQVLNLLEQECFNRDIPIPNFVEYSNQLRLIYILDERVGATTKSMALVKKIELTFANRIKWLNADKQNALTNGVRLVGSYNTNAKQIERIYSANGNYKDFVYKDKATVKYFNSKHSKRSADFIYSNYKYSLQELAEWLNLSKEEYIKIKEEKIVKREEIKKQKEEEKNKNEKAKKTNRRNNISYIFASDLTTERQKDYSLQMCRIADLETIQAYYGFDMPGKQEYMTFLYRNFCIKANISKEDAEEKALLFYNKFIQHDNSINRMESKTRNTEKKQYKYKSETILEDLEIGLQDEINMQLKTIISVEEKKRRQKIANTKQNANRIEERTLAKQKRNEEFISRVKELKAQGKTQKEIAEITGKSLRTIKTYWNK